MSPVPRSARAAIAALLWLSLSLAPAGAEAVALRRALDQVEQLLERWEVTQAEALLTPLARSAPTNPRVIELQAELAFLQGRYDQALTLAGQATRASPRARSATALEQLIANTRQAVAGYVEHRSAGGQLQIWTAPGKDEILAPFAIETLERMQRELQAALGLVPGETVRVEIYPRPEVLAQVSPLSLEEIQRSGTIALCKYNRLMIVTPRALLRGYPWLDTLAHELVHLAITRLTRNNAPIWLHEGLAKFFEAAWRLPPGRSPPLEPTQEHLLAQALSKGTLIGWEQMHPSMAKLPSQQATTLAFAQVQTAIDFLAQRDGLASLRRLAQLLAEERSDWKAVRVITRLSRQAFTQEWKRYLRSLNLRRLGGLVPPELAFGQQPSAEQRIAAVKEERARKYLRLAELLRGRGLTRAAIIEYQKARELLGPRDDLVAVHLARAYLEIASPAQAVSALLPVLEYYPELPGPQTSLGLAYLRSGDLPAAERHLLAALRLNPFDPEIHCNLSLVLSKRKAERAQLHQGLCSKLRGEGG